MFSTQDNSFVEMPTTDDNSSLLLSLGVQGKYGNCLDMWGNS